MNECVGMCVCLCVHRCMRVCACVYVYVWFCEPQTKAVNGISLRCSLLLPLICVSLHLSLQTPKGLIMHHSASLLIPNLHLRCLRRTFFFFIILCCPLYVKHLVIHLSLGALPGPHTRFIITIIISIKVCT